jgi:hypothetical protein
MKKYRFLYLPLAVVVCLLLPVVLWKTQHYFLWGGMLFILSGFTGGICSLRKGGWITVISLIMQILPQLLVAMTADAAPLLLFGMICLTLPGGFFFRKYHSDMSNLARVSLYLFWLGIALVSGVILADIFIH